MIIAAGAVLLAGGVVWRVRSGVESMWQRGIELSAGDAARSLPAEREAAAREGLPLTPEELFAKRPKVKAEDNAAPIYRRAFALLSSSDVTDLEKALDNAQPDLDKAKEILARSSDSLDLAIEASAKPSCDFHKEWSQGMDMLNPEVADMRKLGKLVAARAVVRTSEGLLMEAIADLSALSRMGGHVADEPQVMWQLVGMSVRKLCLSGLRKCAEMKPKNVRFLGDLQRIARDMPPFDMASAIKGDAVIDVTTIRLIPEILAAPDGGFSSVEKSLGGDPKLLAAGEARTILFWRSVLAALSSAKEGPPLLDALDELDRKNIEPELVLSVFESFSDAPDRTGMGAMMRSKTELHLTQTYLAIIEYWGAHSRFPRELAEVGGAPLDAVSGLPIRYEQSPAGFKLWGVGPNRTDDGGIKPSNGLSFDGDQVLEFVIL